MRIMSSRLAWAANKFQDILRYTERPCLRKRKREGKKKRKRKREK